jgi:hypothetical protein
MTTVSGRACFSAQSQYPRRWRHATTLARVVSTRHAPVELFVGATGWHCNAGPVGNTIRQNHANGKDDRMPVGLGRVCFVHAAYEEAR